MADVASLRAPWALGHRPQKSSLEGDLESEHVTSGLGEATPSRHQLAVGRSTLTLMCVCVFFFCRRAVPHWVFPSFQGLEEVRSLALALTPDPGPSVKLHSPALSAWESMRLTIEKYLCLQSAGGL